MASEARGWLWCLAVVLASCNASERRFPLREPLWQDTDRRPIRIECAPSPTKKDPKHVACAPEPYVSPLAWDAADNSIFRPLARLFAVDPAGPAPNVNAWDEVPDSAWFENRLGRRKPAREELVRGACMQADLLDGASASAGSWVIDQGKPNGATPGFRIKVAGKYKFMLKTDIPGEPERPTAASAIGAAIYHAVGFNTSCEQVVYFDPSVLTLTPGLVVTDNTGIPRPFDRAALDKVLGRATRRERLVRMQASAWLPGYLLGPFRYAGTRSDDPNDVIPHEDRRELRGARVLSAWLNHFDAREQNTMDSWIAADPDAPDSSPGFIRHYYLDTSDAFGSKWPLDGISRRLGNSYLLDFGHIAGDFVTFGGIVRPWERAQETPGFELFGYYHYRDFDPDAWKNEYPNPAFSRATEHDQAWMARILSRFDRTDIEALVSLGKFSRPEDAAFLTEVLEQRLRKILERYLLVLSPLADARVERDTLCLLDLARRRGVRPATDFQYAARAQAGGEDRALRADVRASSELCLQLPHLASEPGSAAEDPARYLIVTISNGVSRYPVCVHLYDLGAQNGFRIVGLERPERAHSALLAPDPKAAAPGSRRPRRGSLSKSGPK